MPTPGDAAEGNSSTPRSVDRAESPVVNEVFSMFKTYLESKLDEKTKQLESKSKLDKQVITHLRWETIPRFRAKA